MALRPSLLVLLLTLPAAAHAEGPVARAVADLKDCVDVERPICQAIPRRLIAHGEKSIGPLMAAFDGLPDAARILAVLALRGIEHERATRALVKLSRRPQLMVRSTVITGLGDRTGAAVDKALVARLKDRSPLIREEAAKALGRFPKQRNRRVVTPLLKTAEDRVASVASAALVSACMLEDRRAMPKVRHRLASADLDKRKTALFCLRFIAERRDVPLIIELLRDSDPVMVRDANRLLKRLTGKDYGADYYLWHGWWEEEGVKGR